MINTKPKIKQAIISRNMLGIIERKKKNITKRKRRKRLNMLMDETTSIEVMNIVCYCLYAT